MSECRIITSNLSRSASSSQLPTPSVSPTGSASISGLEDEDDKENNLTAHERYVLGVLAMTVQLRLMSLTGTSPYQTAAEPHGQAAVARVPRVESPEAIAQAVGQFPDSLFSMVKRLTMLDAYSGVRTSLTSLLDAMEL
jgi:hypothetical protein